ncbi:MAG: hypothetical protein J4G09_12260 [Proteobacteria bacterium]|nr:hypothetical protein [Pseudomonadota bacterium]
MSESIDAAAAPLVFADENGKDLLGVLERRVEELLDRHREALSSIEDLQAQLAERGREVERLAGEAAALRRVRDEVQGRVDGLIARVDEIEKLSTPDDRVEARPDEPGAGV